MYLADGLDWFFWNSVKLTFFNFIMLMPLGIYLSILFNISNKVKAVLILFFVSFSIETMQFFFGYFGLISGRGSNIDDIIVNTLGGFSVYIVCELLKNRFSNWMHFLKK